jgi:hypothetical protein
LCLPTGQTRKGLAFFCACQLVSATLTKLNQFSEERRATRRAAFLVSAALTKLNQFLEER